MSEKAECPRCGSYVSEIFYDQRHRYCGWNCHVEYTLSAWHDGDSAELRVTRRPTPEDRRRLAALVGAKPSTVTLDATVEGFPLEGFDKKSPWFDPDREPPKPLSARKAKAAVKALRDKLIERDVESIDAMLRT